jgi:hypothetical protein
MINLFGEYVQTGEDLARQLVNKGLSAPTVYIDIIRFNKKEKSLSIRFFEEDPFRLYVPGKYRHPGIYAIFEGKPDKENCLYVGLSETDTVTGRIYRFTKELLDCSRDDEDHPAAKKARNNRINPMNLYCKILLKKDYPSDIDINEYIIDEYVAAILKARFNKRIKK